MTVYTQSNTEVPEMKRYLAIIVLFLCVCLFGACGNSAGAQYRKITAQEAKAYMDGDVAFILLDVRTMDEFNSEHIAGAILIPHTELASRCAAELPDKTALILVYCRSGNRSETAARQLVKLKYTNVFDFGGIINWPYGTVSG